MSQARCMLILGAASKLGAVLMREAAAASSSPKAIIAADLSSRRSALEALRSSLGPSASERISVTNYDPEKPSLGFNSSLTEEIHRGVTRVFHIAHTRNRTRVASEIKQHNSNMCRQVLDMARKMSVLESLVVVTDVGIAGDYPGRFSESWIDVGQVPFDEVDRSSLEVEIALAEASDLPIIRVRAGILSDVERFQAVPEHWRSAAEVLLPSIRLLRVLPRFLSIPSAVTKEARAPLTPTRWAARALIHLAKHPDSPGRAVHLVVTPPPAMEQVLESVSERAGGARIRGGLPIGLIEHIGKIPGLTETARRQADHLSSWWTPHRYCLSKNQLDTSLVGSMLSSRLKPPSWGEVKGRFFLQFR
ncbi:MAG: hypothetical protein GY854_04535 [Deltaproteobacteria bacterium]|nr:hypothetical protein [Deltaproteobacteria bacterium]